MTEPIENDPYLRERYGISKVRFPRWLITAILIFVIGGAWLLWTANHYTYPDIKSTLISFREVDVEQIGYVYEGLLGYASRRVTDDAVLGFQGSEGDEPEIALSKVLELRESNKNDEKFVDALLKLIEVMVSANNNIKLLNDNQAHLNDMLNEVIKRHDSHPDSRLDSLTYSQ